MTTIPSRLARLTTSSGSWPVAQARSRSLYRQWYRSAPEIVQLYALNIPAYTIRAKVREMFEKNSNVSDPEAVDILLLKGYQDFQETINCWKMESHVMRMFAEEEVNSLVSSLLFAPRASFPSKLKLTSHRCCRPPPLYHQQLPARPNNFLDAFYLSRDDSKEVIATA
ncbi:hypothetical protein JCM5350_003841 [Sporobolomyces pararoseus]